ncbi:MAG: hypothetical protein WC120_03725 [Parcubacteria group bacterium]
MKKFLIPIVFGVVGIIIPVVGMAITPTRDLILGLAPEEAILQFADKIDETKLNVDQNKTDNDNKIQELQLTISVQQTKIAEQEQVIAGQNAQIISAKAESQAVRTTVTNESECRKLYAELPECSISNKILRTKSAFDDFVANEKDEHDASNSDIERYKTKFDKCQEIIKKCG